MHEGDHGILDEAHKEFEAKFGKGKSHDDHDHHGHGHDHDHNHGKKKVGTEKMIRIVSAIIIIGAIGAFLFVKFIN